MNGGNINTQNVVVQSGKLLSEIIGAHDISDFVLQVEVVSPTSPMLERGAIVARLANGMVTLGGAEGSLPADVWGIVLDFQVDSTTPEASVSCARSGVFDATQLVLDAGQNLNDWEVPMRDRGLFLEKIAHTLKAGMPLPPVVNP